MSSEVCPFCGKSYKRLKTHLPHCKAAANSKTPPSKHDVTKSVSSVTGKGKKVPASSSESARPSPSLLTSSPSPLTSSPSPLTSSPSPLTSSPSLLTSSPSPLTSSPSPLTSSPALLTSSPSTKRKKPKSADQLQTTSSLPPPSPPSNAAVPKPKKKSLRALIEAAKSERLGERTRVDQLSSSPRSSTIETVKETKTKPEEDNLQFISADLKHKSAPKKKVSKSKKASRLLESKVDERNTKPQTRDNFWVNEEEEEEGFVVSPGGGSQVRITLQNVKATLGRANGTRPNRCADGLRHEMGLDAREQDDAVEPAAPRGQLQPLGNKEPKSKRPRSIQLQADAPPQPHTGPPVGPPSSKVAGLLTTSPALRGPAGPLRSPLLPPQSLPVRAAALQLEAGKQNTAEEPTGVRSRTAPPSLGQVTLRDLPEWLARRTPGGPREAAEMLQRGWRWYYRRYIDVRKGGVAGVGMLLAGYCTLSYIWTYPHTKLDRWRKYH